MAAFFLNRMGFWPAALVLALATAGAGCTRQAVKPDGTGKDGQAATQTLEMSAMKVMISADKELGLTNYDDQVLLERGKSAAEHGDYEFAARFFRRLLAEYPASPLFQAARYHLGICLGKTGSFAEAVEHLRQFIEQAPEHPNNTVARLSLGLCLSQLKKYEEAITQYDIIIGREPDSEAAIDAEFYKGDSLIGLEKYPAAKELFESIRKRYQLYAHAEIEALTKIGRCEFSLGELDAAEQTLYGAVAYFLRVESEEYVDRGHIAEARFYLAEVTRKRFLDVKLEFPQQLLEERLEQKAQLLLTAQTQFLKTIHTGDIFWAAAAGYRIGSLYEDLYHAMLNAPAPPELTEEQIEAYRIMLRQRVQVLITKAIGVYERNLDMASRTGLTGDWVKETQSHLDDMKRVFLDEPLN